MPAISRACLVVLACGMVACAGHAAPTLAPSRDAPDERTLLHVLNRTSFGPRPGDLERLRSMGLAEYLDEQLHPERLPDDDLEARLAAMPALAVTPLTFATVYYAPMAAARQEFINTQRPSAGTRPAVLRGHLLPIAAMTLPSGERPVAVLQQPPLTTDEVVFQRKNQEAFEALQAQKLLRAVYSERQLQEVLTDFWFNHFNVDASKIEERPVVIEYERTAIRPHVLGRFRELLGATAQSPAMLFYLDNWLSTAPPPASPARSRAAPPRPSPTPGRGLNENYARELLELHTLGVDGGYTQKDVVEVARCFTGWTMRNPHDGRGFVFDDTKHDHGEKRVLGHRIRKGRGIEDGLEVLDILARHPSTARFIATKLTRRFVADDPPPALVDRVATTFRKTDGDVEAVMRAILTSPEFLAPQAYRAKVKSPFEYVASALRATSARVATPRAFVTTIGSLGEPLYQCQPPTGYGDRAGVWINTGTLIGRLNFAVALATNGLGAASVDAPQTVDDVSRLTTALLADDLSEAGRTAVESPRAPMRSRLGFLLGSPEFQRR
jgi:uncharacterized protein (DUF1800 family)